MQATLRADSLQLDVDRLSSELSRLRCQEQQYAELAQRAADLEALVDGQMEAEGWSKGEAAEAVREHGGGVQGVTAVLQVCERGGRWMRMGEMGMNQAYGFRV
jgi:hypothetical protein